MLSARPARVPSPAQPRRGDGHHQHGTHHRSPADHRRVDTHLDLHVAHANDQLGRRVDTRRVPTTPTGYQDLLTWARGLGQVVLEVNRPDRQASRRGKSDPTDAEAAARAVQAGQATVAPKAGTGQVEMIRREMVKSCGLPVCLITRRPPSGWSA